MSGNKRVELLSAAEASDVEKLADIVGKKKSDQSEVADAITEFSKSQLEEFWQNIYNLCTSTLLKEQPEEQSTEDEEAIPTVLKCVSSLGLSTLTALQVGKSSEEATNLLDVPQGLQEVAIILHGVLPTLDDKWQPLKNQMCRLFENWWIQQLEGKEEMVANTVAFLLSRCTEPNSSQADVSRIWAVHPMLELVDFKSDVADAYTSLLQQCCRHPQFIATSQGAKFVSFILTLSPNLTEVLHQAIKNHLPATPKSWHAKYGEIYLRAWQKASDDMRQKLEEGCIQDLMYRAVHAYRGVQSIATTLFRLLSHLHKQKTQRGVEAMLARLYEPILWRALRVANSDVRLNAAALMFDVFPLQDPTLLNEQADIVLQRQFDIMHSLMTDPVPEVRVRAILGVGNVLNLYWELIPSQVIQCFVTTLVSDLVHDVSSPSVREAVIKVMFLLCDNHLCIPLLKKVLPELKDFIHDTSEKVRLAMFDLLLKVKGLRAIKFWSIVPVEHILARLEIDSPPIVRRIMRLISSSFVPISQPSSQQVERCLSLITSNRAAARQFFLNLPESLGPVDTAGYILVLCRYALESSRHLVKSQDVRLQTEDMNKDEEDSDDAVIVKKSKVRRGGRKKGLLNDGRDKDGGENTDNIEGLTETDSDSQDNITERSGSDESSTTLDGENFSSDVELLSGLMEAVYLMFTVISPQLNVPEHAALRESLMKKLSITVREMLNVSQNNDLDNALIALAGHLPSRSLPMISQKLINRIKQNTEDTDQCSLAIKSLIQWGKADDLMDIAQEIFVDKFQENGKETTTSNIKAKKKKTVAFVTEKSEISFDQAANIILTMLSLAESRLVLKKNHRTGLRSFVDSLKCVIEFLRSSLSNMESETSTEEDVLSSKWQYAIQAFSIYLRVSAFLAMSSAGQTDEDDLYIRCSTTLALELAIPCIVRSESERKREMASQVIERVIKANSGLLMVGCYTAESLNEAVEMSNSVLKTPQAVPSSLTKSALTLVYQFTQLRMSSNLKGGEREGESSSSSNSTDPLPTVNKDEVALTCLTEALKSVSLTEGPADRVDGTSSDSYSIVAEIIQALTTPRSDPGVRDRTLSTTADSLIEHLRSCSKHELIGTDDEKLPAFIASVMATIKRKSANKSSLIREIIVHLESDTSDIHSIHGIACIVPRLRIKDQKSPADLALEEALQRALPEANAGCIDEDVFRDLKLQVEQKIKSWVITDSQPSTPDT